MHYLYIPFISFSIEAFFFYIFEIHINDIKPFLSLMSQIFSPVFHLPFNDILIIRGVNRSHLFSAFGSCFLFGSDLPRILNSVLNPDWSSAGQLLVEWSNPVAQRFQHRFSFPSS